MDAMQQLRRRRTETGQAVGGQRTSAGEDSFTVESWTRVKQRQKIGLD